MAGHDKNASDLRGLNKRTHRFSVAWNLLGFRRRKQTSHFRRALHRAPTRDPATMSIQSIRKTAVGFTLIELMIVVAIIAILAAIARAGPV
ncbi:MAG: prepilin-type N-terminal cleavage/methylation domain-containing protein [Rudaea sp.]